MEVSREGSYPLRVICILSAGYESQPVVNSEDGENENDSRCGKYPSNTPSIETDNGDRTFFLEFLQEYARNDKARDDKKDINPKESTMEARQVRVVPDDQTNRQRSEGLYVRAKRS